MKTEVIPDEHLDASNAISPEAVKTYLLDLQSRIVGAMETLDGQPFRTDSWSRPEGGGGISRLATLHRRCGSRSFVRARAGP